MNHWQKRIRQVIVSLVLVVVSAMTSCRNRFLVVKVFLLCFH